MAAAESYTQITFLHKFDYFREGYVIWPNANGFFGQNGLIQLTKHVSHTEAPAFITKFLKLLRFPCIFRVDAHGFITDTNRSLLGFQFASRNTSMQLMHDKSTAYIGSTAEHSEILRFFEEMSGETFLQKWFDAHDRISELVGSGFQAKRTTNLVMYLEPEAMPAQKIFDL